MHAETQEQTIVVDGEEKGDVKEVRRVYEQRWSAFLHAAGILVFVSPPFMHVLGLTPTGVMIAGLFLFMGEQSLSVNPILYRTFCLLTPPNELPTAPSSISTANSPTWQAYAPIHGYTLVQIIMTVVIFVVSLTKGAPAFPVIIIACVPARLLLMNRIWRREVLRFVDAWACREGTPEDDEDHRAQMSQAEDENVWNIESTAGIDMQEMQSKHPSIEPALGEAGAQAEEDFIHRGGT
jgi:hypothetical protein